MKETPKECNPSNEIPNFEDMARRMLAGEVEANKKHPDRNTGEYQEQIFMMFAGTMKRLEEAYLNQTLPNPKIAEELITSVIGLLIETNRFEDHEKLSACLRFYFLSRKTFISTFGSDLESYKKRNRIGVFVTTLSLYSDSPIIAPSQKIVAAWLGEKERYIRSCYENFENRGFWMDQIKKNPGIDPGFSKTHSAALADLLIEQDGNPFPQNHPKVLSAYQAFRTKFMEEYEATTLTRDLFSYAPDFEAHEERKMKMRTMQNKNA